MKISVPRQKTESNLATWQDHSKSKWMKVRTLLNMTAVKPGLTGIKPRVANWQANRELQRMKVRTLHGMTAAIPA